jgi:hypothetical protein
MKITLNLSEDEVYMEFKIQIPVFLAVTLCSDVVVGLCCLHLSGEMSGTWKWTQCQSHIATNSQSIRPSVLVSSP